MYARGAVVVNPMDEAYLDGHTARDIASTLRTKDKPKFVSKVILDVLDAHKSTGLTISQIAELTGFSRDTVSKHLEILEASREVYKVAGNSGLYHKNGRVLHYRSMENSMFSKRFYTFYYLNNAEGNFIYIQEKELGRFRSVDVKGGIMVGIKDFKKFVTELTRFAEELNPEEKASSDGE
ncbi:HTH domain-containing protein [Nitrososphaera sp.]|uniref:HTH domain-containing protein n=1 Tax=Nitrososphaera sp. TaxID=1971748 RepID=UPI00316E2275